MLENCTAFRARAGVLTNITEDHLDRFGTMARYAEMKGRIWDTQRPDDLAIGNAADPWTMTETAGIPSRLVTFDSRPDAARRARRGAVARPPRDRAARCDRRVGRPRGALPDLGPRHRRQPQPRERDGRLPRRARGRRPGRRGLRRRARLPAVAAPHGAGRRRRRHPVLRRQQGHQRRLGRRLGARLPAPAGADRRRRRQGRLVPADARGARRRVPGHRADRPGRSADPRLRRGAWRPLPPSSTPPTCTTLVRRATELCGPGDAVVLSPACSSYDMFQNFGHRGRVFRDAVAQVTATRPSPAAGPGRPATGGASG